MVIRPLDGRTYCVRSALAHVGLSRKLYDCSRHKLRARKCLIRRALLTFSSISNLLPAIWKGDFSIPKIWGLGRRGVGDRSGPFDSPSMGYFLLPFETRGFWLKKRFRPSDPDTITNTKREAIPSSSNKGDYQFNFCVLEEYCNKVAVLKCPFVISWQQIWMAFLLIAMTYVCFRSSSSITKERFF